MTTPAHYGLEHPDDDPTPAGAYPGDLWVPDDPRAPINARKPRAAVAAITASWGARPPAHKLVALALALEDWGTDKPLAPGEEKLTRWTGVPGRALEDALRALQLEHVRGQISSPPLIDRPRDGYAKKGRSFGKFRITAPPPALDARQVTITTPRLAVELLNFLPRQGMTYADRLILSVLATLARDGHHAEVSKLELSKLCGLNRGTVNAALGEGDAPGTLTTPRPLESAGGAPSRRPLVLMHTPPTRHRETPAVWDLSPLYDLATQEESDCG